MLLQQYAVRLGQEPQSSYHSPTNLFLMDLNNDTKITQYGESWVVSRTLPMTDFSVATMIGAADADVLKELSQNFDIVECTETPPVSYFEDKDNAEYVYGVEETVTLVGRKYKEVRRKRNRFKTLNSNSSAGGLLSKQILDRSNTKQVETLWGFFEKQRDTADVNAQVEMQAFEKWLMFADQLPTDLVVITKEKEPVGFCVVEVVGKTLLVHFFKTEHSIVGLAEYLFVEIARMYHGKAEWINFQQDLGIDGLRQFKNHLQPTKKLTTFVIMN